MAKRNTGGVRLDRAVGKRSGLVKQAFSIRPDQLAALVRVARARADEAGRVRPDMGEVVREALDLWLARNK